MDRDAVLKDLQELGAVRGANAAEAKTHQGRGFLGVQEPGGHRQRLAVVVGLHLGQRVQVDDGGPLAGEDAVVLHRLGKGVLDDAVVFGLPVDGQGVQHPGRGLGEEQPREEHRAEDGPGQREGTRRDLHGESSGDRGCGFTETDSQ